MTAPTDVSVALIALIVSLIALVVTTTQLLAQIFATADGTRKCSTSVLGAWGKRTRWKWRWSEGRFETIFTTPEIFLGDQLSINKQSLHLIELSQKGPRKQGRDGQNELPSAKSNGFRPAYMMDESAHLIGEGDPALELLIPEPGQRDTSTELVGWIALLQALRENATAVSRKPNEIIPNKIGGRSTIRIGYFKPRISGTSSWPALKLRERSWDFMPPDALRPLATSNISDIAIMIRRLGMIWKEFDPANYNMTAEGGPHVLNSVSLRGLGLVLQYKYIDRSMSADYGRHIKTLVGKKAIDDQDQATWKDQEISIWTRAMDKLLFGILPGHNELGLPDFCIATWKHCLDVLEELNDGDSAIGTLQEAGETGAYPKEYGFNDLILMAAPVLRQRGSIVNRVPMFGYWPCLMWFKAARKAFLHLLRKYINEHGGGTEQLRHILGEFEFLSWADSGEFSTDLQNQYDYLEYVHDLHDKTTLYFKWLEIREESPIIFYDLLKAHFSKAPMAGKEAWDRYTAAGDGKGLHNPASVLTEGWRSENMRLYFAYIPDYAKYLEKKGCEDKLLAAEAWITLIWRAFCWQRLHTFVEAKGNYLPLQYYGSQLPIYLG